MGSIAIVLMATGAGAAVGSAAGFALGAGGLLLSFAAVLAAGAGCATALAALALNARSAMEARFDTLAQEMILIRQRQAESDQTLQGFEKRALELPMQVWQAATSDIEVLGTLVNDLAKTVAEHDAVIGETKRTQEDFPVDREAIGSSFVLPRTTPPPRSWFEEDTEEGTGLGLRPALSETSPAMSASPQAPVSEMGSPSIDEHGQTLERSPEISDAKSEAAMLPPSLIAKLKSKLVAALSEDRFEVRLQPYVSLPQRRVVGYEATLAMKAGEDAILDAAGLATAASLAGKTAEIDRQLVERVGQVLRVLRARERAVAMTCTVSASSLLDPGFRSAVEAVALAEGKLAENIILSIPATEAPGLLPTGRDALESLRRTGVGLGLRATTATGLDLALLENLRARELRLPANALIGNDRADIHPADVSEMLDRRNVKLLVTDIESEAMMRDLLDCAAAMGQGSLFGSSRPVRPEILQPRPVAEQRAADRVEAAKTVNRLEQQGVQRQSFRSLLRRA